MNPLTQRETEVLALLANGFTQVEVAEDLCVSRSCVSNHVTAILFKLDAANITHAVYIGTGVGILHTDTPVTVSLR